mgnify:CR=1 FL=1
MRKNYFFIGLLFILMGCSASWKAPIEVRSSLDIYKNNQISISDTRGNKRYLVKSGDTLYAIAWRTGVDFKDLAKWNRIAEPYKIYEGQSLHLSSSKNDSITDSAVRREKKVNLKDTYNKNDDGLEAINTKRSMTLNWDWPIQGKIISSFQSNNVARKGIKLQGNVGDNVIAAEKGKIVYSGSGLIGYGKLVIVKHNNNFLSAYGHNSRIFVNQGETVKRGQKIAEVGRSNDGRPLLHFEIRKNGNPINPINILPPQ